jgi:endonuclease/exonuclease/phosphatase family metal-dependent hydrolase
MSSQPPETDGANLRVMTFNLRFATAPDGEHAWPLRREAAMAVIREARPHLIGLQEALSSQLEEICAAFPGYAKLGVGRDDGVAAGEHAAILYDREPLEVVESGDFWFSDTPEVPGSTSWGNENVRMCTFAHVRDRPSGKAFWHYNLHIDHASAYSRARSIDLLLRRIGERTPSDPAIATGDFNVGEDDAVIRRMVLGGLVDTFRAAQPDAVDAASYHGFTGGLDGDKIDYIFCGPELQVVGSSIWRNQYDGHWPSDHFPVVADLRL